MALAGAFEHITGAWNSLLGKRSWESSEGRLDGRPTRRRKNIKEDACRPSPTLRSKQLSMTGTASGPYRLFDPHTSAQFFGGNDSDEEALSANPVADLPNPGDDVQAVSRPTSSDLPSSEAPRSPRVTRSTHPWKDQSTEYGLGRKSVEVKGGFRRRAGNDATSDSNMPARQKPFTLHRGFKPMNTLNNTTSTRSQYQALNTKRSLFPSQSRPDHTHEQSNAAKRTSPPNPANPPFKRPRVGESPMQGRSKSNAISVDDSQEFEHSGMDDIQHTPERKLGNTPSDSEAPARSTSRGGATDTRTSSRQQQQDIPVRSHLDSDESRILPTSSRRPPNSTLNKQDSFVDLDEAAKDSDDEAKAIEFTKDAAERRRSGKDSSSPDRCTPKARTGVESSYFTRKDRLPATARRKAQSPEKAPVREYGSQSPDVIQQGTTTREPRRPNPGRIGPRKGLSTQSASTLAANIVGNPKSTRITTKPRSAAKVEEPHSDLLEFEFSDVKCSFLDLPKTSLEHISFFIDMRSRKYFFDFKNSILESASPNARYKFLSMPYPIHNIMRISHGDSSSKVLLQLSNMETRPNGPIVLDLVSHMKVIELIRTLLELDPSIPISHKEDVKLDSTFKHVGAAAAEITRLREQDPQRDYYPSKVSSNASSDQAITSENSKQRPRMVDRLENAPRQRHTIITGKDREMAMPRDSDDLAESTQPTENSNSQSGERTGLISRYFGGCSTRAHGLRSASASEKYKARSLSPVKIKFSQTGGLGKPWAQPLTYPKDGKKRENVGHDDLWRLDDDEFLNDTLIGFFLRYLQYRTEVDSPEVLKKMHFFNSYFFDTLNKGTKTAKTINHEAVARWTRNVNLFSRDFVIVPVNENLHWFVAIICNLSYFERQTDDEERVDDTEEEPPPAVTVEGEGEATGDQGRRTKETQQSFEDLTIDDNDNPSSSTVPSSQTKGSATKGGRGRKKKYRRSLPKYETDKPVVITFDSLGIPRSSICTSLKQYVVQEAKSRKDLDISDQEIKGMTAKNIPTQGNYSDCGLYMCMYLEQFMCDPHGFIRKLLQREESQIRWPTQIHSNELRTRMRNLIMNLHREQEGEQVTAVELELGKILVDMRGPSPEPELEIVEDSPPLPHRPSTSEELRAQKQRLSDHFDRRVPVEAEDGFEPEADGKPMSASSQRRHAEEAIALVDRPAAPNEHNTVVIDDDGSPVKKKKRLSSPSKWKHREPGELAAQLKTARGSPTPAREERSNPNKSERGQRSHSVSTDFLHGARSFANGDHDQEEDARFESTRHRSSPIKTPSRETELPAEVPETQEEQDESESDDVSVEELKPSTKQGEGRAGDEEILV